MVGGAGLAGQTLIKDIDNGYVTKFLLTPTRRPAVIWEPMVAGAIVLTAKLVLVMVLALAMGVKVAAGPGGFALVVVLAFLWGMAFAGYAAFMALKTKHAAAAKAATINPTTYVFDSMRSLLNTGWNATSLLVGFAVTLGFATLTGAMALWAARRATKMTR